MNLRTSPFARLLSAAAGLGVAAGLIAGCSTAVSPGSSAATNIAAPAVSVPVLITDAPSDQLVAFSLTLNSIILTDSAGQTASILPTATTIEVCHLNGVQAPLVTASIPQDTYTSATIAFSSPQITYINSSGQPVVASPTLTTTSFKFTFPTPFTVSNSSTSLLIDLLAAQSVTISGTTVDVAPVFKVTPVPPATAVPPSSQNGTGMQQMATVVSVSGSSVTLEPGSGPNFTVTTNSSTLLLGPGFTSLSDLTAGELVQVSFIVESGGVYLATSIQIPPPPPNGAQPNLLTGPVTSVSSGSFQIALMQGAGPGVAPTSTGAIVTVSTSSSTTFAIAPQFVSLSGLPFTPTFNSANLVAGQTVGIVTSAFSASAGTATATTVYLAPQTLDGTVTTISTVGGYTVYTLSLNSGSAFTSLSGASTVTVYTSGATAPPPNATAAPPAIAVNSQVRFNGLVFNLGGGKFAMVAGCSPDGAPGI
jgi:hypothetical protein